MSQYDAGGSAPRVNPPRPNPPRKKPSGDADWGSWLLIAIMFATGLWPIGLFLLVKKLSDGSRKPKTSGSSAPRQTPAAPAQTNSMRSQLARTPQYSAKGCRTMRTVGHRAGRARRAGHPERPAQLRGPLKAGGGFRGCSIPGARARRRRPSARQPLHAAPPVSSASTSPAPGSAASSPSPSSRRPLQKSPSARPRRISS